MMSNKFVIVMVLCSLLAGFCACVQAQENNTESTLSDDEWVPVPLEEIEQATLQRHTAPDTPATPAQPETPAPSEENASQTPAESTSAAPAQPQGSQLTPEEIARRLRSNGPSPVVPARGARPARRIDPTAAKEGQSVVSRIGSIKEVENTGTYLVTFENNRTLPYQAPCILLPCRLLEEIETHLQANPNARYRMSGEGTRDTKNAYLLLQRVAIVDEDVTDVQPAKSPTVESKNNTAAASQPASASSGEQTSSLIAQMLQDRPGSAVKIAPSPHRKAEENVQSVAPAGKTPFTPGKQDLVVDRIVRVIRESDSDWWLARFESDNTLREPPLHILPGLRLEWIKIMMSDGGKTDMLLRVSGDVTYYKGKRYLMLRKVLRQRDLGEF